MADSVVLDSDSDKACGLPTIWGVDMTVEHRLEELRQAVDTTIPQKTRKHSARLYIVGVGAKLHQADFALHQLAEYRDRTDEATDSTQPSEFTITDKVHYYCDSYWTFLYSSLDVLGQVLNQVLKLGMNEHDVSFKAVRRKLARKSQLADVHKAVDACCRSHPFKNLEKYRNCSTHRRQIYLQEVMRTVRGTAGYKTSTRTPVKTIERLLCDNPLQLSPKTDQQRRIPDYMEETRKKIRQRITSILRVTKPVR